MTNEASPPRTPQVPRFMRRRVQLVAEIAGLTDDLEDALDRAERTSPAPACEPEPLDA